MELQYKEVPVGGVKVVDEAKGIVEAIVSVTGVVDEVKDVIEPGAYEKTLAKRTPKGVWSHAWDKPVARTLEAKELMPGDPHLPKKTRGGKPWPREAGALMVKMQFNLNTARGRDAYEDVKFFGDDAEWSVGYQVPMAGASIEQKSGVRRIKTMELYEFSPVLFGAMPMAVTQSVKSAQLAYKALRDSLDEKVVPSRPVPPTKHPYVDKNGDGKCDVCGDDKDEHRKQMGKKSADAGVDDDDGELTDDEIALIEEFDDEEKALYPDLEEKRQFTSKEREDAADEGHAMSDGSFPIKNGEDLKNAVQALGRAKDKTKAKRHIMKRARALGLTDQLPDDWKATAKALEATFDQELEAKVSSRSLPDLDRSPKKNWVEEAGGLPSYIERIAKHLHYERGMTIGHAIAAAVNRVKKWAAGGDNVKPDTRAKAAKAVAEWEAKKGRARATKDALDEDDLETVYVNVETKSADLVEQVADAVGPLTTAQADRLARAFDEVKAVLTEVESPPDEKEDELTEDELLRVDALRLHTG